MKKSSKVLSLVLAVLMAVSCFSGLTIFSASAEETDTKIYFDASNLPAEWGTTCIDVEVRQCFAIFHTRSRSRRY